MIEQASLDDIKASIERLRAFDLRSVTLGQLEETLRVPLTGWRVTVPVFDPGLKLFRATARFQDGTPPRMSDFGYPPPAFCRLGRANRKGKPMLYCSAGRNTVFFEMNAVKGSRLAVIHYETTCPLMVNRIGFTEETFRALDAARIVPDYGRLNLDNYTEADHLINDFLSEVFCQRMSEAETYRYKLSAAVAEKLLGENPEPIQGLMYPTIPMWANADNFALRPQYADRCLRPVYAEYVEVAHIAGKEISVNFLDEARRLDPDGGIRWLGHQGTWQLKDQGDQLVFEAVDGHWIARDPSGNIVDPE